MDVVGPIVFSIGGPGYDASELIMHFVLITLSNILGKLWSHVSSLPPRYISSLVAQFVRRRLVCTIKDIWWIGGGDTRTKFVRAGRHTSPGATDEPFVKPLPAES